MFFPSSGLAWGAAAKHDGASGSGGVAGIAGADGSSRSGGRGDTGHHGLSPNTGFLGRAPQVQIAAAGTMFQAAMPTVDFGDPGITVSKAVVNSDGNLTLSLNIADTAKYGDHDVTLTSGGSTLKLTAAFTRDARADRRAASGSGHGVQGGLVQILLRNQDYVQHPFITTFGSPQLGGAVASAGITRSDGHRGSPGGQRAHRIRWRP